MVKRTSFEGDSCPIARSLEAIGDWWSLLIIREALFGLRRFGEFQSKLGMAKNILSVRLRSLVEHGILATAPASDGSAYQEYVLTPKGRGTLPDPGRAPAMERGVRRSRPRRSTPILVDREKGRPVKKLELRAEDGRLLSPADIDAEAPAGAATAVSLIAARCHHTVIASAARQSRVSPRRDSGLLRCARNDCVGGLGTKYRRPQMARTPHSGAAMPLLAIVYFSISGTTEKLAHAVARGADGMADVALCRITGDDIVSGRFQNERFLETIDGASAVAFGSPTYMGGPAAQFKLLRRFERQMEQQAWANKIAAGFTTRLRRRRSTPHIDLLLLLAARAARCGLDIPGGRTGAAIV